MERPWIKRYSPHAWEHERTGNDPIAYAVQNNGTALHRFPELNFSSGLVATEDIPNRRITVSADVDRVAVPASAGDSGLAGQIAFDSNYLYICVNTNTWRRVAIASW